jgi:hypothetical protein
LRLSQVLLTRTKSKCPTKNSSIQFGTNRWGVDYVHAKIGAFHRHTLHLEKGETLATIQTHLEKKHPGIQDWDWTPLYVN